MTKFPEHRKQRERHQLRPLEGFEPICLFEQRIDGDIELFAGFLIKLLGINLQSVLVETQRLTNTYAIGADLDVIADSHTFVIDRDVVSDSSR